MLSGISPLPVYGHVHRGAGIAIGNRGGRRHGRGHTVDVASRLQLVPRDRPAHDLGSGAFESSRRFLDFEVDGKSLYDEVRAAGFDHIGAIWLKPRVDEAADAVVARLLADAPPDLPGGRVAVFVCPECGDLGCGAITVELVVGPTEVQWRDWAWQTDYDPEPDRAGLDDMRAIHFDRASYEEALRSQRSGEVHR